MLNTYFYYYWKPELGTTRPILLQVDVEESDSVKAEAESRKQAAILARDHGDPGVTPALMFHVASPAEIKVIVTNGEVIGVYGRGMMTNKPLVVHDMDYHQGDVSEATERMVDDWTRQGFNSFPFCLRAADKIGK